MYDGTVRDANGNIIYNEVLAGEGPKFAGEYHDESNTMTMTIKIHGTDEFTYDVENELPRRKQRGIGKDPAPLHIIE